MSRPDNATKLLFVCSRNKWRSLTAEKIFADLPGYAVRSAGTEPAARIKVTGGHIRWADLIFAMEKCHVARLRDRFGEALAGKPLICLNVPDDFQFMDPDLVGLLKARVGEHIDLPE
jgi:predicted protein tyrosine phosphatase